MAGKPTPLFYLAVFVVVAGLAGYGLYQAGMFGGNGQAVQGKGGQDGGDDGPSVPEIDPSKLGMNGAEEEGDIPLTVREYTIDPAERLPEPKGTSGYAEMEDNTVRFALNVWAGWAPIIFANEGSAPGKVWKTPDGKEFKVELVLIDNPVDMRDAYSAGQVHIGWATLDMMPLFMDGFLDATGKPKDSRVMPRIYQQVDWSNGGDGIVVRDSIKSVGDLRGKKIALAQNSPSHYFLLMMLVRAGVQPSEVDMVFTPDAFQAAAAFNADKTISACVSWAPDIYNLDEAAGNKLLVSTGPRTS